MKKAQHSDKPSQSSSTENVSTFLEDIEKELEQLKKEVGLARESERRAVADYQNLHRRTQEDKGKMAKFAARSVVESILQPLEHLYLAKEQLKDKGLDMVYQQFQMVLQNEGLEEISVMGKEFDPETMEVVHKEKVEDATQVGKVVRVMQRGYRLNGEVLQHAKVVVGE